MAKRRVVAIVRIQLPAGKATPAPPVCTALGPHGVQTMEFCKQYNAATEDRAGVALPAGSWILTMATTRLLAMW